MRSQFIDGNVAYIFYDVFQLRNSNSIALTRHRFPGILKYDYILIKVEDKSIFY